MSREGFKLEKKEIREIINSEIEKHGISINEKENYIVNNIVDSCPSSPNTTHLLIWCNNKVSKELDKYPDMNEDIKEIRNEVGKELRYKLDKDRFQELKERIEIEKPEIVTPQWIRSRFYALSLSIRRGYKNIDGSIDWDFISKKLNIENIFYVQNKESWNNDKEKIINSLNNLLEEKSPIVFSPDWIDKYGSGIHHQLKINFKTEDGKTDWDTIKNLLNEKWQKRWHIQRHDTPIIEVVENIIQTFELQKPKNISPKWLSKMLPNDYAILKRLLPNNNRELDYQILLDLLPKKITEYWKPFLKTEKIIPKESYVDIKETDSIINKHKDKIYTFYYLLDKENDKNYRENIINEMRDVVMKGNINALDRLVRHLTFMAEGWIENDPALEIWKYAKDRLSEVIKRCIYRFDSSKGKFATYLYVTLKKEAVTIKINSKSKNFKKRYIDGDVEYYENDEV